MAARPKKTIMDYMESRDGGDHDYFKLSLEKIISGGQTGADRLL